MSVSRIIAGAVALALGAAVVTALAGATPEENADNDDSGGARGRSPT